MQLINLSQAADVLEMGTIEQTINLPSAIVHIINIGTEQSPCRYILTNDDSGISSITPDFFN